MENNDILALQTAFEAFKNRSQQLEAAYGLMEKQFEKLNLELEETHTILNSILDTMNNGVVAVDTGGKITQFNAAAQKITGYSARDAIGAKFEKFFGEKGFSEKNDRDEKVIWNKDGLPVPVVYQSSLLRDTNGNLLGAVEIFSDISKIKQLESENQQNRVLAALGEMAATLAHEIKNPLGAMGTWARLLDKSFDVGDKRKETLAKITDALSRLNKIVSSMLIFGRQSKSQLQMLDIKPFLSEFTDSMEIELVFGTGAEIDVVKNWDETPLLTRFDPEKLRQILLNLCLNAVQAMKEGELKISCKKSKQNDANYTVISVSDTGSGIPLESREKIFTPFHTTKENGTGLGLAIVKKLVDFHGGVINLETEAGKGTSFHIFLPLE